ncbi:hypothetical protein FQN60_002817 [Etheostoma spectabile]|uniref:Uncharacterized protein n=1 Tax=Etheostoma spectabile TaxID=54343 RepID=A0A5J5CKX9_9PERO|nr:hypothetical protein FQN60_002817 [Etheostoma spectabile]
MNLFLLVIMKVVLFELLVVWLLGALHAEANTQPEQMGLRGDEQRVSRRYAESAIASEISKIMDSLVQKNFASCHCRGRSGRRSERGPAEALSDREAEEKHLGEFPSSTSHRPVCCV